MPYLVSSDTAKWIRRQKAAGGDIRARFRRARPGDAAVAGGVAPQWRVTAVPDGEGGFTLRCSGGIVWIYDAKAVEKDEKTEVETTARSAVFAPADLGAVEASGRVVWRWTDGGETGEVLFVAGGTPDGSDDVLLAEVTAGGEGESPKIAQKQIDTIFWLIPTHADGDDGEEEEGGNDAPPCGHPLNGDGAGAVDNPLDGGGGGGKFPDDDTDGHDPDDNPLDHEGPGGFTPECGDNS